MIDSALYLSRLSELLRESFGERLLYIGLQGSYLRGEASENSDIDIMVVLDTLSAEDLARYRAAILSLDHFEKSCGFICGREDLAHWNPLEIWNLLHGTQDYFGVLRELVPAYTKEDIRNFAKLSVGNLYHEICHRYMHAGREKSEENLPGTYKGVFFILQSLYYLRHGEYVGTRAALTAKLDGIDRAVMERSSALSGGAPCDFDDSFALLLEWCQNTLRAIG